MAWMILLALAVSTSLFAQGQIETIVPADALPEREYYDGPEGEWVTVRIAPITLAMDKTEGKIYWAYDASIHRADLDGSGMENFSGPIFEESVEGGFDLTVGSGPKVSEFHSIT